ncbi:hypothetical protein [Nesterenkonia sp.]|uniref:hypothetical protein n=1 Tax=Nesterenkonia sp. TaxID=704201 RepID=UPI0026324CF7|nr:hypothetical protein [Nesterenkonia sp.]
MPEPGSLMQEAREHRNEHVDVLKSVSIAHDFGFVAGRTVTVEKVEEGARALAESLLLQGKPLDSWERLTPFYQDAVRRMVREVFTAAGFKVEEAAK